MISIRNTTIIMLCALSLSLGARTLFADQTITVTGTVPPQTKDFTFALTSGITTTTVNQNMLLPYTITYGALNSAGQTTNVAIKATYTTNVTAGVSILDYVPGSATNGYNNAPPVIDIVNHTITWNVALPKGITHSVRFMLKTNANYTGSSSILLTLQATAANQFFTFGNITAQKNYQFSATNTPTPTQAPTATPTPKPTTVPSPTITLAPLTPTAKPLPTPTLTPTPLPTTVPTQPFTFTGLDITGITSTTITVQTRTNYPSAQTLYFGTGATTLSQSLTDTTISTSHTFTLPQLNAHTIYYFQAQSPTKTSDILSATTALPSTPQEVAPLSVVFASQNTILTTKESTVESSSSNGTPPSITPTPPVIVLPVAHAFEVDFQVTQSTAIRSIIGILKNTQVLGVNTFGDIAFAAEETQVPVVEKAPGVYTLNLTTPAASGHYELQIQILDAAGNVTRQKVGTLNVSNPITVFQEGTHTPISNARVQFYRQDLLHNTYLLLPAVDGDVMNPSFTDSHGEVKVALAPGNYKITVGAPNYDLGVATFTIGGSDSDQYPIVSLHYNPLNLTNMTRYIQNGITDTVHSGQIFSALVTASRRLLDDITILASMLLIVTLVIWCIKRKKPMQPSRTITLLIHLGAILFHFLLVITLVLVIMYIVHDGIISTTLPLSLIIITIVLWSIREY